MRTKGTPAWARKLEDFARHGRPFFSDTIEYDPVAALKHLASADLAAPLGSLVAALREVLVFEAPEIESALRAVADRHAMKAAPLIHAARVAVTGESVSAGIFEVLSLLGRTRTIDRLDRARSRLNPPAR